MRALVLFILVQGLFGAFAFAQGMSAIAVIRNMDLRNCLKNTCIQMRAEHAESGAFTPLMSLKNVKVDFYSAGLKSTYVSTFGYIDFERNVVMMKVSGNREMLFNLNDMKFYKFDL